MNNNYRKNNLGKNNLGKNNLGKNKPSSNISMSFILKILAALTLIIICIIILVVIARNTLFITNMNNHLSPIFILDDIDAKNTDSGLIKNAISKLDGLHQHTNYSFSTWIYIQNWDLNLGFYKVLFSKSYADDCKNVPLIALDKYENNLIFAMDLYDTDQQNQTKTTFKCVYKNIPLQKWVNIIYLVSDRYVSLFINGNIEKRCHFKNIYCQNKDNKNYTLDILGEGIENLDRSGNSGQNGFDGRVSKMQYFAKHLSNDEIKKIYENGPYIS